MVPATVTFVDIAGLVRGASQGEGLGNQFLAAIRETDAICQVVRAFHDDDVVHVDARVDPAGDIETVNTELILADLQTVEHRLPRLAQGGQGRRRRLKPTVDAVAAARAHPRRRAHHLERGGDGRGRRRAAARPAPVDGQAVHLRLQRRRGRAGRRRAGRAAWPTACARRRRSSCAPRSRRRWPGLDPADAAELLRSYGQEESGLEQLVHVGFATLGLQTFLTAGPKEARAWTIHVGDTAPKAAGVIHTDFERGFIKAEVISFDDLMAAGSVAAARTAGKARMEGKDYVMRDGDVVEFRFNT